jgi:hypothetical protein
MSMITTTRAIHQSDILGRLLGPAEMPPEAARFLVGLELCPSDRELLNQLAEKARQGTLSSTEERDLEEFRRVGRLVEVLKLKARKSLESP